MDGVECVEELFLRALLTGEELDVVDEEPVEAAIALAELLALLSADRVDELVGELLARRVGDALLRMTRDDRVTDRVHKMGLSKARAAVDEERVVAVTGAFGDGKRRGVCQTVVGSDHEGRERVPSVQQCRCRRIASLLS